jgi:3-oxosteroid 1-dehydrogenase
MNEGGSYMLFCQGQLERHKTVPAVPSWLIVDSQYMKRYMLCEVMPGDDIPKIWWDTDFIKTGKTLEELAAACNIPADNLKATTEKFNRWARQGKDEEFGRGDSAYDRFLGDYTHTPNDTLGTVEKGPFYAVEIVPGDVGTYGGVVCNANAQVLMPDGKPIEALYATGTTTAGVMGRAYPGAGCSIGPSFTWGFVAAKHAANLGNIGV